MNDLLSHWDSIGHPNILVVGDIILDEYTWGDAERVSPEAPVLVMKVEMHEARLGGAACVAGLLRGLEADVTLAGVIGDDPRGRVLIRLLNEAGIDSSLVHCDAPRPTTSKSRLIGRADGKNPHHLLRVDEEWGRLLAEDVQHQLAERILSRLAEFDAVLISDYGKGVCRSTTAGTTFRYEWHEGAPSCESSGEIKNTDEAVRATEIKNTDEAVDAGQVNDTDEGVHATNPLAPALRGEGGGGLMKRYLCWVFVCKCHAAFANSA